MGTRAEGGEPSALPLWRVRRWELVAIGLFILVNLLGPLIAGERFPFTIAPMFCGQPTCYCEYVVTGADGESIPLEVAGLQRVYDGNPVGLGVGVVPPATLDEFGRVPEPEELREHLEASERLWQEAGAYVDVQVRVIGDVDGSHVGEIEDRSYQLRVRRPGP